MPLNSGPSFPSPSSALRTLLAVALMSVAIHIGTAAPAGDPRSPGTIRMAERLAQMGTNVNWLKCNFLAGGQVGVLKQMLAQNPALGQDLSFRYRLAEALLNAGRNTESLAEFDAFERLATQRGEPPTGQNKFNLRFSQALCYLREGERLNCQTNHNADSCLLPIRGGGIHRWQTPSRTAASILTDLLKESPDNLSARWLLNIAAMTVGEYPDKVPARWLIPPSAFASEIEFPRFRDIAPGLGLALNELSGGSIVDDFDGDELLDIMTSSIGLTDQMHFFHNNGDGTFTDRTREAGLLGLVGGLNMVSADFDNDGHLDLLVLRGGWMREEGKFPNSLLRNRGDGTFEDVTEAAGVLSFHPTQTAVWFDFDGDGWLDLYIGNESIPGESRHLCELYRNQGDGTFKEIGRLSGVTVGDYVKGVVAGDFNNDGKPDLYVSVLGGRNRLFRNDGPRDPAKGANAGWQFTDVAKAAGVTEPIQSFPCWFFDYDNDGWEDIFVAGYRITEVGDVAADYLKLPTQGAKARLYHNRGNGTFEDVTAAAGVDHVLLAMGSNFGDLDNDGWLDFYLGTGNVDLSTLVPNRMFRNSGQGVFRDITTAGGFGQLQKGHGVSFADIDNDGDQDIYEDLGGGATGDVYPNVLFENPGFGNHWLKLRLQGVRANRCAIGARVRIDFEEKGQLRSLHRTIGTGGSFGANPLRLEAGLGQATRLVSVTVLWPGSGTSQKFENLAMDKFYRLREGDPKTTEVALKRLSFSNAAAHSQMHLHH